MDSSGIRLVDSGSGWRLEGVDLSLLVEANAYLGYLDDRNYSPRTVRAYGYGLQAFYRWLGAVGLTVAAVGTEDLLGFVSACRQETVPGRGGPNVVDLAGRRTDRLAPGTVNLRLAAVSGLFEFLVMRDPSMVSPIPAGRPSSWFAAGERTGLLAHTKRRPAPRSRLRLRTPRRLPRALSADEVTALLGSLRTTRDLGMAGLMLYCGLRSCEVLALPVTDVDIGGRWLLVAARAASNAGSRWTPIWPRSLRAIC